MITGMMARRIAAAINPIALSIYNKAVSAYDFDGGSGGFLIDSKASNDLTNNGATQDSTAKIESSLKFTSETTYATQSSSDFDFLTGSFFIAGWFDINGTTISADVGLVGKYRLSGNNRQYSLLQEDGKIKFVVSADGSTFTSAGYASPLTSTGWYFIAAWRDVDDETINVKVYGSAKSSAYFSGSASLFNGSADLTLGRLDDASVIYANNNNYKIDCLLLGAGVLSNPELDFLYNSGNGRSFSDIKAMAGIE